MLGAVNSADGMMFVMDPGGFGWKKSARTEISALALSFILFFSFFGFSTFPSPLASVLLSLDSVALCALFTYIRPTAHSSLVRSFALLSVSLDSVFCSSHPWLFHPWLFSFD